jgi:formate hydrogenlyase subunit 3/multisubunit Na+/H+ antiporter MnhD subunit
MSALPLLAVLAPLALAALLPLGGRGRRAALALAPWAALPALALAALPEPPAAAEYPWLLLGARVGVDGTGRVFLLLAALLWTVAGAYARAYHARDPLRERFWLFWLLTLAGNLGVAVALDVVGFYLSFALMTFSAYGLVIHAGSGEALRAGRVYVAMAVLGEGMLLSGILLGAAGAPGTGVEAFAASLADSPHRELAVGLLLGGFGIKAGAVPLHVWLPLAHPVAPTPASAVLSGCMIKAGLLGWLRFLPLGEAAVPGWGAALVWLGILAAFFGVAAGATQRDPKTALAYSSISQMGFLNVAVGVGLLAPEAWPYAGAACLVYALHHGLAKGALFLGVGVAAGAEGRARGSALAALALPALAVAGAPLTSGSVAKSALKGAVARVPEWPVALDLALSLAAVGSTLLMGRFLVLVHRAGAHGERRAGAGLWVPWGVLLAAVAGVLWVVPGWYELEFRPYLPAPGAVLVSVWPLAAGGVLLWTAVWGARALRVPSDRVAVAPGDLVVPVERGLGAVRRRLAASSLDLPRDPLGVLADRWHGVYARSERGDRAARVERELTRWGAAVVLFGVLVAALAGVLVWGAGR